MVTITQRDLHESVKTAQFDYDYGDLPNLKPGEETTEKICSKIIDMFKDAAAARYQYEDDMRRIDAARDCYMAEGDYDKLSKRKEPRRPTNIAVPLLYTQEELFKTYMGRVFLGQNHLFPLKGDGDKTQIIGGALLDRIIAREAIWFGHARAADIMHGNAYSYGRSTCVLNWKTKRGTRAGTDVVDKMIHAAAKILHGINLPLGDVVNTLYENEILYEGTELRVLDQWRTYYDPDCDAGSPDEASFFQWTFRTDANTIMRDERDAEERGDTGFFNGRYLQVAAEDKQATSTWWEAGKGRGNVGDKHEPVTPQSGSKKVDCIATMMDITPKFWPDEEHRISNSDKPERWLIIIGADRVPYYAARLDNLQGGYPLGHMAPTDTGQRAYPTPDMKRGLAHQDAASWALYSMIIAHNTMLNGKCLYNSAFISREAMTASDQGMAIPVNPGFDGDMGKLYHQILFENPTAQNLPMIAALNQMASVGLGNTDAMSGDMSSLPERPGQAGIQAFESGGFSRMKRKAQILDCQFYQPVAMRLGYNEQQHRIKSEWVGAVGHAEQMLRRELQLAPDVPGVLVTPQMIRTNFCVIPRTGFSLAPNETTAIKGFLDILLAAPSVQELFVQEYRAIDLMSALMRQEGFENLDEYRQFHQPLAGQAPLNPTVMPNEQIAQQYAAGNLVRMGVQRPTQ